MTDAIKEIAQHLAAAWRVDNLGVELDPKDPVAVGECSDWRVAARRQRVKARRKLADVIAVAHPHGELGGKALEQSVWFAHCQQCGAVLAGMPGIDLAAEVVGDQLHAVADAEHRDSRAQSFGVDLRGSSFVHARGPATENQPNRRALLQFGPGGGPRDQLAVHIRLAHATGDQLAELRPEVEDENGLLIFQRRDTLPRFALHCFAVLGGRGSHAQVSSSPYPRAGPAGTPCLRR